MRRVGRQPCPAVPAAGVEPAAFSFSGRRSYRLSYTGIRETPAGVEPASRSGCSRPPEPSGPTSSTSKSRRWDSNPHAPLYRRGARPVELHWHCRSRVDSRLRSGSATVTGSHAATTPYPPAVGLAASIPVRSRTSPSTFARSRAAGTLRGQPSVPRPGVEPGPAPSEGAMMSLSPPGHRDPGAGIEPALTGSEPVVLPLDDPGRSQ